MRLLSFSTISSPLFFFSSRRRHTRLQGDWSSDVCSSDLGEGSTLYANDGTGTFHDVAVAAGLRSRSLPYTGFGVAWRSEERRVGKGWRTCCSRRESKQQRVDSSRREGMWVHYGEYAN